MAVGGRERRQQPRARKSVPLEVVLTVTEPSGSKITITGRLMDVSEGGVGVELPRALPIGTEVRVQGELAGGPYRHHSDSLARISWCVDAKGGYFKAGLAIVGNFEEKPQQEERIHAPAERVPDYYDVLQVSSRADRETIDRVFRLLAQRYHPDNQQSGSADLFRLVVEAHRTLSDPAARAEYDVKLGHYQKFRWQMFDQVKAARGPETEKRQRTAILHLLYTVRRNDPSQPALGVNDLEDLLGAPKEHLTFSLWYLKESGLVTRTDNGRYAITVAGVDRAEASPMSSSSREDRVMIAGSRV